MKFVRGKVKSASVDFQTKAVRGEDGTVRISGLANTPVVDRYNEVVDVTAFASSLASFMKNPVMLWMHSMRDPIGLWDDVSIKPDGLHVSGVIHTQFPMGNTVAAMAEAGLVRGLSIGFIEKAGEWDEKAGVYHITDLDLMEVSVVSIPANQESLFRIDDSGKATDVLLLPEDVTPEKSKELFGASKSTEDKSIVEPEGLAAIEAFQKLPIAEQVNTLFSAVLQTWEDVVVQGLKKDQDAEDVKIALSQLANDLRTEIKAAVATHEQAVANMLAAHKQEIQSELETKLAALTDIEECLGTVMDYTETVDRKLAERLNADE
jgi:HK97 family phage prohead protease